MTDSHSDLLLHHHRWWQKADLLRGKTHHILYSIPTWNSHQLISERYQRYHFRNLCNHTRSHGRNPKDPTTRTQPSYVDSGTGGKIRWGGTEHHLRKCARMYEKCVESYALHIPRKRQLKPFLFHFTFKLKLIIFKSIWLLSHVLWFLPRTFIPTKLLCAPASA